MQKVQFVIKVSYFQNSKHTSDASVYRSVWLLIRPWQFAARMTCQVECKA